MRRCLAYYPRQDSNLYLLLRRESFYPVELREQVSLFLGLRQKKIVPTRAYEYAYSISGKKIKQILCEFVEDLVDDKEEEEDHQSDDEDIDDDGFSFFHRFLFS